MQLPDMLTAGFLVQAINVLGDDAKRFAFFFQLCNKFMCVIGLCVQVKHLVMIETIELIRMLIKEGVGHNLLRRIGILHLVQSVLRAEIRNTAVC